MLAKNHNFNPKVIVLIFVILMTIICVYTYKLITYKDIYQNKKKAQYIKKIIVDAPLENIYDRNGFVLAVSVPGYSYFLDTTFIKDEKELRTISRMFNYPLQKLIRKYEEKKKFVWLKRNSKKKVVHNFRSVFEVVEFSRYYPYGNLTSHILGVRNIENDALGGVELSLNSRLQTTKRIIWFVRSADGKRFLLDSYHHPVLQNKGIITTIDIKLQKTLYEIALTSYEKWKPKNLVAIAIDSDSGDILAWIQIPTFNPLKYNKEPLEIMKNIALTSPVEPGSIFKPFFYYTLLEKRIIDDNTKVDCENGHFKIRARHIYDHTPRGILSAKEVIAYSSNIGITKLTQKLSTNDYIHTLKTFQILDKFSIGFKNTLKTKITPFNNWSYHTLISLPMGYEILTTPFHLIRAYAMLANGGYSVNLSILKNRELSKKHVLDTQLVAKVQEALKLVTKIGTARRAESKLYIIMGKTGTSKLLDTNKRYTTARHRSFFVGFTPNISPRLLIYFQLDQPQGAYFGGTVAAPYVKESIEKSLQKLFIEFEENETSITFTQTKRK